MCAHGRAHTHTIKVQSWLSTAGHGTSEIPLEILIFLCKLLLIGDSFLISAGSSCAYFPSQYWRSELFEPVQAPCRLSVTVSISHVCIHPAVSGRHYFLSIMHLLWLWQAFCLLFHIILQDRFNEDNSFKSESSRGSHSLHVVWLWASVSVPFYCRWKLLSVWWWLSEVLICGHSRIPLGVISLLCSFNRTIVLSFSLAPWPTSLRLLVTL